MAAHFGAKGAFRAPIRDEDILDVLEAVGDGNESDIEELADLGEDDCQFDASAFDRLLLETSRWEEEGPGINNEGEVESRTENIPPAPSDAGNNLSSAADLQRRHRSSSVGVLQANSSRVSRMLSLVQPEASTSSESTAGNATQRRRATTCVRQVRQPSSTPRRTRTRPATATSSQQVQIPQTSSPVVNSRQSRPRPEIWKEAPFDDKAHDYAPCPVRPVRAPMMYYTEYFNDTFFEHVSMCTNNYYMRQHGTELKTNRVEIMKLIGIQYLMGCFHYPRVPMYWRAGVAFEKISSKMSRDRFLTLRNCLHVVETDTQPPDATPNPLWKVQPMIDQVRNGCYTQERAPGHYSIDEQMIPFTGRCALRQVVKNKPRPVGIKNFVLTSSVGLMLDFDIYRGARTMFEETSLGLGPSVILHLSRSIPQGSCVYHDRFFTTVPLIEELNRRGIHSTGTIMANRIPDRTTLKFKKDNQMSRGETQQMVRNSTVLVKWKDNTSVIMASNCTGSAVTNTVKRWDKTRKVYIDVPAPQIVINYNKHMGGVDVLDQSMEYYRNFIKTKKWTLKVLVHFFDLAVVNAWRAYRIDCLANNYPRNKILELLDFRLELAEVLMKTPEKRRADDGEDVILETLRPGKYKKSIMPSVTIRHDGYNHLPNFEDIKSPRACQYEYCKSRTKTRCIKCNAYLCIARDQNCFREFHSI